MVADGDDVSRSKGPGRAEDVHEMCVSRAGLRGLGGEIRCRIHEVKDCCIRRKGRRGRRSDGGMGGAVATGGMGGAIATGGMGGAIAAGGVGAGGV